MPKLDAHGVRVWRAALVLRARGVFDSYETPKDCASSVRRGVRSSTISWIEGTGRVRGFE